MLQWCFCFVLEEGHKGGRMDLGGIGNECNRGILYEILR